MGCGLATRLTLGALRCANAPYHADVGAARVGRNSKAYSAEWGAGAHSLPFRPGLVGGHCIGVDPYYLTYKAQQIGYHPEMILAGRRINDGMGAHVAQRVIKLLGQRGFQLKGARVLILGFTFKENCPDVRNTRVIDIVRELRDFGVDVLIHDPVANADEVLHEYGETLRTTLPAEHFAAVIVAVAHEPFRALGATGLRGLCIDDGVLFDVKAILAKDEADGRL